MEERNGFNEQVFFDLNETFQEKINDENRMGINARSRSFFSKSLAIFRIFFEKW